MDWIRYTVFLFQPVFFRNLRGQTVGGGCSNISAVIFQWSTMNAYQTQCFAVRSPDRYVPNVHLLGRSTNTSCIVEKVEWTDDGHQRGYRRGDRGLITLRIAWIYVCIYTRKVYNGCVQPLRYEWEPIYILSCTTKVRGISPLFVILVCRCFVYFVPDSSVGRCRYFYMLTASKIDDPFLVVLFQAS